MSFLKSLSDYFIGTDIFEHYRHLESYHREFKEDPLGELRNSKYLDLLLGKAMPNVLSAGAIVMTSISRNPSWLGLGVMGESLRLYNKRLFNQRKEIDFASKKRHIQLAALREERTEDIGE